MGVLLGLIKQISIGISISGNYITRTTIRRKFDIANVHSRSEQWSGRWLMVRVRKGGSDEIMMRSTINVIPKWNKVGR